MDVSKLHARAEDAIKKNNLDYAIEIYKTQILTMYPNDVKARKSLRACQIKKHTPKFPKAGLTGMKIQASIKGAKMTKNWDKVIQECENFLNLEPKNIGVSLELAQACKEAGHLDSGIASLQFIVDMVEKNNFEVHLLMGQLCIEKGDHKMAEQCFLVCKKLNPNHRDVDRLLKESSAQLTMRAGYDSENTRDAMKDQSENLFLEMMQKKLHSDEERETLLKMLDKQMELEPKNKKRYLRKKAEMLGDSKKFKESIELYEQLVQIDPTNPDFINIIGELKIKQYEHSLDKLNRALEKDPKNLEYLDKRKKLAAKIDELRLEELERKVKAQPNDMAFRYHLRETYLPLGRASEAIGHFQMSIKDSTLKQKSQMAMGRCWMTEKEPEMAIENFRQALGEDNTLTEITKEILYHLADAYEKAGNKDEAEKHFKQIMKEDISFRDVRDRIKKLKD